MTPVSRRVGWLVVLVATAGWLLLGAWVMATQGPAVTARPQVAVGELFTPAQLDQARDYYLTQRWLNLSTMGLSLLLFLVVGLTRLGPRLIALIPGPWWLQTVIGSGLLLGAGSILTFPLKWWSHQRNIHYGLSAGGAQQWFLDQALDWLISWVITSVSVLLLIWLLRRTPNFWPLLAALGAAALVVLATYASPVVIEPAFNKFTPLSDRVLLKEIGALARAEGVGLSEVLVADATRRTTTLNAYVSGLGPTRRVVIYDTMLDGVPRAQLLTVVAHELSHARHRDQLVMTALGALAAALGMGLLPQFLRRWKLPPDARLVPRLLALGMLATLVAAPAQNAVSRTLEARADRDAVAATGDRAAAELLQIRLARTSLADPDPPRLLVLWFGTHPSTLTRVGIARTAPLN